tara:strand:+ start:8584 stop:10779 length:2196 start_codon:yes stop_codon:yes gene_type:complete
VTGRAIRKQLANGTRTSMAYDTAGRETQITHFTSGNTPFSSFADTYNGAGNRTQRVNLDGDVTTWTYDLTAQVLSERSTDSLGTTLTTFVYDPVGNRLVENADSTITTSVYDAANRLQASEKSTGITTYTYDKNGNQTSIEDPASDITTYTWTYENQLAEIESPNGDLVTYTYAPVNKKSDEYRLTKETDLEFTSYLWDDQNIILEQDEVGTVDAEYTVMPKAYGNLISQTRDAESSFYHFDPLGSTRELTDETETVTDSYLYSVFGKVKSSTGTTVNPYQWVGKQGYYRDPESGLYSLRNRFYDSNQGRFKSEDPIGFDAGDVNLYRYVGNNAATLTDPSGLDDSAHFKFENHGGVILYQVYNADHRQLNGTVGGLVTDDHNLIWDVPDPQPRGDGRYYCASRSRIILAVRNDEVTDWRDWGKWFKKNGFECNGTTGLPINKPWLTPGSPKRKPARPPQSPRGGSEEFYDRIIDVPNLSSGCFPTKLNPDRTCREAFEIDFPNATKEFGLFVAKELAIELGMVCVGGIAIKFSFVLCGGATKVVARILGRTKELTIDKLVDLYKKLRRRTDDVQSQDLADQIERELRNINQFDENISLDPSGKSNCVPPKPKKNISFVKGEGKDAVKNIGRVDHAGRHLSDFGVIAGRQGTKAFREAVRKAIIDILENPIKTFDHVMKQGNHAVKGFYGKIDGKDVVVFVAKEPRGKINAGDLVTTVTPTPQQMINWGLR